MENRASPVAQMVKNLPSMQKTWVRSLDWEDPLKKEIATHSSILAWRISWTEEPGRLQAMGSQRIRHNQTINTLQKRSCRHGCGMGYFFNRSYYFDFNTSECFILIQCLLAPDIMLITIIGVPFIHKHCKIHVDIHLTDEDIGP